MKTISDEESEEFDDLNSSNVFLKKHNKLKEKGRKCQCSETLLNDLVDINVEHDKHSQKLLMTNTKNAKNGQYMDCVVKELNERCVDQGEVFPFDTNQTRQKFRRCVVACRAAALKIKTSSGIKPFQEPKHYEEWFSKLMQYVVTMDSCQRGQGIEPSATEHQASPNISGNDLLYQDSVNDTSSSISQSVNEESSKTERKHFVPDRESGNKTKKKESIENVFEKLNSTLNEIKKGLSNEDTNELTQFLKEDSEKQANRDSMFLILMSQMVQSHSIHSTSTTKTITKSRETTNH